jgi:subfamily B ATP-binding cassette protein MsbA
MPSTASSQPKKKVSMSAAWNEARGLIWTHRKRLTIGLVLMLISRLAGLVLPASSKYLIDDVLMGGRNDLLLPIALAAGAATLVQAVTSFALSQILGVAAQRAITDMRKRVQARIMHCRCATSTRPDRHPRVAHHVGCRRHPESRRHRTGAAGRRPGHGRDGLGVLFWLNWHLTVITIVVLARSAAAWPTRSARCGRCSASAARSTPR